MSGTKTVRIYKRIVFIKKLNKPSVTTFKGSENKLRTGFRTLNKIERINPLMIKVFIPPAILTPGKSSEIIKSAIELNTVFRRIAFILKS